MLMRNLESSRDLAIGTGLNIINITPKLLTATIIKGTRKGQTALIPKIALQPSDSALPFELERCEFKQR